MDSGDPAPGKRFGHAPWRDAPLEEPGIRCLDHGDGPPHYPLGQPAVGLDLEDLRHAGVGVRSVARRV